MTWFQISNSVAAEDFPLWAYDLVPIVWPLEVHSFLFLFLCRLFGDLQDTLEDNFCSLWSCAMPTFPKPV